MFDSKDPLDLASNVRNCKSLEDIIADEEKELKEVKMAMKCMKWIARRQGTSLGNGETYLKLSFNKDSLKKRLKRNYKKLEA